MYMRTGIFVFVWAMLGLLQACQQGINPNPAEPDQPAVYQSGTYNQYGYNFNAKRFKGTADGADLDFDGMYYGKSRYADAELTMKWNDEWDRGHKEGWVAPPYEAECQYSWKTSHGNGAQLLWQYDIYWVGSGQSASPRWKNGGFPIWSQFEVVFSGRTAASVQFWELQALPPGRVCPL